MALQDYLQTNRYQICFDQQSARNTHHSQALHYHLYQALTDQAREQFRLRHLRRPCRYPDSTGRCDNHSLLLRLSNHRRRYRHSADQFPTLSPVHWSIRLRQDQRLRPKHHRLPNHTLWDPFLLCILPDSRSDHPHQYRDYSNLYRSYSHKCPEARHRRCQENQQNIHPLFLLQQREQTRLFHRNH